jgi:hypothetical protein
MFVWATPRKWKPVLWCAIAFCSIYSTVFAAQYRLDLLPKNDRLVAGELVGDKIHFGQAVARARVARQAGALLKENNPSSAIQVADAAIQRHGEDRTLLKILRDAYVAEGDARQSAEADIRLQQFLDKRLY